MDVMYGLLSNLVKTKSIQRILAPIASQISLLIILNESEDGARVIPVDMVPCSQGVMEASNKLITAAKQQAHASTDKDFIAETLSSCDVLELSCTNLMIASQQLDATGGTKEGKNKLVQASKDILQGTMKVLLVADDAEVRRIVTARQIVEEKLVRLEGVTNMQQLVPKFKEFTEALSVLTSLTDKRQRDLLHGRQRERIITSLNVLKKSVASLSSVMQTSIKYGANSQAGKTFVIGEIQQGLGDIVEAVQNRDSTEEPVEIEGPGTFITRIDQVLEALGSDIRDSLHPDVEMWTEELVRHSMMVAHLCYDTHRDLIVHTCQRVIQLKSRLIEMQSAMELGQEIQQIRLDYDDTCETLIDEFCELEKNVNISLLHLVVDKFKETTQPLERLVKRAVYSHTDRTLDLLDPYVSDFVEHAEKLCQIALLAAASSTDARRVQVIRTSVQRLEILDPELISTVISASRLSHDKGVTRHLKLLMNEWTFELTNVVRVLDIMTDPKMFMLVSERKVEEDINTCRGCIIIQDEEGFRVMSRSLIGRSRRVAQVAEGIVDSSCEPMFRNGLMAFIQQLRKAITAVRSAVNNLESDLGHSGYQDTLKRRFTLLQDCLIKVRAGLSSVNHPHVLSPLRRNVRQQTSSSNETSSRVSHSHLQKPVYVNKDSKLDGDLCVSTSVSSGSPVRTALEDLVVPRVSTNHKAQIGRTRSGPEIDRTAETRRTYAWKLAGDLISMATKGDKHKVNILCGELLGWTNHIVDACHATLVHCGNMDQKRDLKTVCYDVDQLASSLQDSVKYVLHGDFSRLSGTKEQSENWAIKIEQARVYVDVTVEEWKSVCDSTSEAAASGKRDLVLHLLEKVQGHQQSVCDFVALTSRFRWEGKVKGQDDLDSLWQNKNDLENLTVTFKTATTMMTEQGLSEAKTQCDQLGRDWSVKVYSMLTIIQDLTDTLLNQGLGTWPQLAQLEGLTEYMAEENGRLKDLMKSACYGDPERETVYKELLADMSEVLDDMKTAAIRKKVTSASNVIFSSQYTNLRVTIYKAFWVLKASQCLDIARQQTYEYSGSVDVLIDKAFLVLAATGQKRAREMNEFSAHIEKFTTSMADIRKRVLSAIQLSSELSKRSVIRQCLDKIGHLQPQVVSVIKSLAEPSEGATVCKHQDVSWHRLLWSARVRHLVVAVQEVTDIKPTVLSGILKVLQSESSDVSYESVSQKLEVHPEDDGSPSEQPGVDNSNFPSHLSPVSHKRNNLNSEKSKDVHKHGYTNKSCSRTPSTFSPCKDLVKCHDNSDTSPRKVKVGLRGSLFPGDFYDADEKLAEVTFDPVIVDMTAVEGQIIENARQAREKSEETRVEEVSNLMSGVDMTERQMRSGYSRTSPPVLNLKEYIERQTQRWEEDTNPIVKMARTMATQVEHMSQYIHRHGPITSHLGFVKTAKALAENSEKILQFANILIKHCIDPSFCADLVSYRSQVPTIIKQLTILANGQLGTAETDTSLRLYEDAEADHILVQNSYNLMRKIVQMMDACEAVCVKGLSDTVSMEDESAVQLARRWRQKYQEHRHKGNTEMSVDELGLRIVEDERAPPALNQMFKSP